MSIRQIQQRVHSSVSAYQHHIQPGAITHQKNDSDSIQYVLHLLCIGQIISKQTTKVAERLRLLDCQHASIQLEVYMPRFGFAGGHSARSRP